MVFRVCLLRLTRAAEVRLKVSPYDISTQEVQWIVENRPLWSEVCDGESQGVNRAEVSSKSVALVITVLFSTIVFSASFSSSDYLSICLSSVELWHHLQRVVARSLYHQQKNLRPSPGSGGRSLRTRHSIPSREKLTS